MNATNPFSPPGEQRRGPGRFLRRTALLALALIAYGGSYALLVRSGTLMIGERTLPGQAKEKRFIMLQRKPFSLRELLQKGEIDLAYHPKRGEFGGDPIFDAEAEGGLLSTLYTPAGWLHQILQKQNLWPTAFSPRVRALLPVNGATPEPPAPSRSKRSIDLDLQKVEEQVRKDPVWEKTVGKASDDTKR
jgi:hypothetical protein